MEFHVIAGAAVKLQPSLAIEADIGKDIDGVIP